MTNAELIAQIRELAPWHHDIQINDEISTGKVFSSSGKLHGSKNETVSLISPGRGFRNRLELLYPDGCAGKRFLDCACNAGGYCFWAADAGFEYAYGFDIREHWIKQGLFVKEHRSEGFPSSNVDLDVMDLYAFPSKDKGKFDMTYFSGIFYHIPDPITGLRIAADRTEDILFVNTVMMPEPTDDADGPPTRGMTLYLERTDTLMTGVHQLSWVPNNNRTLFDLLKWMGFEDVLLTMTRSIKQPTYNMQGDEKNRIHPRRRVGIYAAREPNRLAKLRERFEASDAIEVSESNS